MTLVVTRTDSFTGCALIEIELGALKQIKAALEHGILRLGNDATETAYVRSGLEELLAGPLLSDPLLSDEAHTQTHDPVVR